MTLVLEIALVDPVHENGPDDADEHLDAIAPPHYRSRDVRELERLDAQ